MMRVLLVAAVVGCCACTPERGAEPLPFAPAGPDDAPDPAAFGPYPVGVRTVVFVDEDRTTLGLEGPRQLATEIWYPAAEAARDDDGESYVLHDQLPPAQQAIIAPEALGTLDTAAVRDAPPRADDVNFPLVVFSHGKGGIRLQSTYYTVLLASHGYVVAAPDHAGDTIVELLENPEIDPNSTGTAFVERPIDVGVLLDRLLSLPTSDPLSALIDPNRVGVTGHSFGALTSFIAAGVDARVRAVVGQTPVGVSAIRLQVSLPLADYGIPMMIQSAGLDRTLPEELHAQSVWDALDAPRFWMQMHDGGHFTYSDLCIFDVDAIDDALGIDASNVLEDGCGPENTPTDVAFPLINRSAVGFFNAYLRGSPASLEFVTQESADDVAAGATTVTAEP